MILSLTLFFSLTCFAAEPPAPAPYELHQQPHRGDRVLLRLTAAKDGRTVWSRTAGEVHKVVWSGNRRAVAVVTAGAGTRNNYRLLTWRAGERARTPVHVRPLRRMEGLMDLRWSPDNRRLLILGPLSMGGFDAGMGDLWVHDTVTGRSSFLTADAMRAEWLSPSRLRVVLGQVGRSPEGGVAIEERPLELDIRTTREPDPASNYPPGQ